MRDRSVAARPAAAIWEMVFGRVRGRDLRRVMSWWARERRRVRRFEVGV